MTRVARVFTLSEGARRSLTLSATSIVERVSHFSMPKWDTAVFDSLSDARDMLDRLENTGRTMLAMRILDDDRFEVRWRDRYPPPPDGPR